MPSSWCDCCQRSFSSLQYFSKHIFAASNRACLQHYHSNLVVGTNNKANEPPSKRRRIDLALLQAEKVIQEEKENQAPKIPLVKDVFDEDDDVFEFNDDDYVLPEVTYPRINLDYLKRRKEMADDSISSDEDNQSGDEGLPGQNSAFIVHDRKPNSSQMEQFKAYVEEAEKENLPLSPQMKSAIFLMRTMNRKRGSIELYEDIAKWHVKHSSSEDALEYISSKRLHEFLIKRYNLEVVLPKERRVYLPYSKETVSLTCFDAKAQTVDLLTDPRITDDSFLFFEDDPFAVPPEDVEYYGDINTGLAYRTTYKKLIAPEPVAANGRRKVLLPYILYLDGTVVGRMNQNLGLEILKFTLGILKGGIRTKKWAWRNLGHMKKLVQAKRNAEGNIRASGHIDSQRILPAEDYKSPYAPQDERPVPDFDSTLYQDTSTPTRKRKRLPEVPVLDFAQDFHKMLQVLLSSYKEIEEDGGIEWDFRYDNETHKVLFVPFIIFFKVDGKEGDKLCGQYTNKNEGVACLCRSCCCPTKKSNNPYLDPAPLKKTPGMIIDLVKKKDWKKMKELSQKPIWNALYELRFGLHDDTGVHGACPWEVMHWVQLNMFKYLREGFFLQTGETTILSTNMDTLCITIGELLKRQSDRSLPRIMFKGGIRVGMLQAHHMVGVMLLLAFAVRSCQGRRLLMETAIGKQKPFFNTLQKVRDWSRLLETILMFYSWLMQDEFKAELVERAIVKVKEVMCMIKAVGQREKGMGDNRSTFHGTLHVPESIINFGAPKHVHTECTESFHRDDKATALTTQKRVDTMDEQVGRKTVEREAVELGVVEIQTRRTRNQYFRRLDDFGGYDSDCSDSSNSSAKSPPNIDYPVLSGIKTTFFQRKEPLRWVTRVQSRSADKDKVRYEAHVLYYLEEMARELSGLEDASIPNNTTINLFTTLKVQSPSGEGSQIYYANPMDGGRPNYNWAQFQINGAFCIGQMKAFIDFRELPSENNLHFPPGVYILVEPATRSSIAEEQRLSELFEPWVKTPCTVGGFGETHNDMLAVHIDQLRLPSVVVPDLGNANKRAYLRMVPRWQWPLMFEDWLEQPHRREWDAEDT